MKLSQEYNDSLALLNHYKLMYSAGKITKDGAAHNRMHQLFDNICKTDEIVERAKKQIKKYEE